MINTYYRGPDGKLRSSPERRALEEAIASGQGLIWVDIEGAGRGEASLLEEVFEFHHLAIDDCFNQHVDPPKIDDYERYIFIIAQAISSQSQPERLKTTELDVFLGPNYVVSVHDEHLPFIATLRSRCEEGGPELAKGADFLAHALLDALVDDFQPIVEDLDVTLERLEERVLSRTTTAVLEEILLLKRNVQRLRRLLLPQRDVMNRVARGEFPGIVRPESHIYFRDIYDHVVRVEDMVESLRDLSDGILSTYLSAVNNRMNEVMKTLSVVAAIFLPLTLIASIYGMNFENMPELGWQWGYFGILGAMAALAFGLVAFFRVRGWF
ncbi:MAG: magnesium/cobalt transporter CorA [Dehalococcoidia bacterium]